MKHKKKKQEVRKSYSLDLSDQTHERSNPSLFFYVTLTTLIIFQEPESSSKKLRSKNDQK
jgi:hypothetical protein